MRNAEQPGVRRALAAVVIAALAGVASAQDRVPAAGPADPAYAALEEQAARYRALAETGWPPFEAERTLRAGDSGPEVAALRERLALEGFSCPGEAAPDRFDAVLDCAVRAYQDQRGLDADGAVGRQTREALNVPAAARAQQIDVALARWAALAPMPARRIEVNIAVPEATLYADGAPVLRMKVIAGKPSTPTPEFSAEVRGVIFNPEWNVPDSIARNEILPRAASDPAYLARNHFERRGGRLVQLAGEDNALGRIKLDMPNPHTVYLHDTPARALFDTARRFYSHGCMRMQRPREMAAALLQDQGWTPEQVDAAIAAGGTRSVPLTAPVPVFVYYRTAAVREDGALLLLPDVYGLDAEWIRDNAAAGRMQVAETECALSADPG